MGAFLTTQNILDKLLCLYAVVPAGEASVLIEKNKHCRVITRGPLSAVVGDAPAKSYSQREAALHHNSIIQKTLESCMSVIPFRFGVGLRTEVEIGQLLKFNTQLLTGQLERLCNRVEMGLKAKLSCHNGSFKWDFGLYRVRSLVPHECDRKECVKRVKETTIFTGCYLIARDSIERYWIVLDDIRRRVPSMRLLGSGPWAPYHFCEFALRCPSRDW